MVVHLWLEESNTSFFLPQTNAQFSCDVTHTRQTQSSHCRTQTHKQVKAFSCSTQKLFSRLQESGQFAAPNLCIPVPLHPCPASPNLCIPVPLHPRASTSPCLCIPKPPLYWASASPSCIPGPPHPRASASLSCIPVPLHPQASASPGLCVPVPLHPCPASRTSAFPSLRSPGLCVLVPLHVGKSSLS